MGWAASPYMLSYRTILFFVAALSGITISGLGKVRWPLVASIILVNIALWLMPRVLDILRKRNAEAELGAKQLQAGNYPEAEAALTAALGKAVRGGSSSAQVELLWGLAAAQRKQGKAFEGEQSIRAAMVLLSEADTTASKRHRARCLDLLAELAEDGRNYPQAQKLLQESIALEESLKRPSAELLAKRRQRLALAHVRARDFEGAAPQFARAVALHEQAFGPEHIETGKALSEIGIALEREGDFTEAVKTLERGIEIQRNALGPDTTEIAESVFHLAMAYDQSGNMARAAEQFERLLHICERTVGVDSGQGVVLFHLARLHLAMGRLASAEEYAVSAIPILEQDPKAEYASTFDTLASIYDNAGRSADAEEARRKARAAWRLVNGGRSREALA
jgi:tetratricopeptide (TPR) repeat protein